KKQHIEDTAIKLFRIYGYKEIITPVFEHTEVFKRAIGETTDIVQKEMYTFLDKSGRSLTLRPEATASVVRAYLEHKMEGQRKPVKLYYNGPMFRYERPQSGRYREFWQLGVEAIGLADPRLDAETIALTMHCLNSIGLNNLILHLNSMGCPECRNKFSSSLKDFLKSKLSELCDDCKKRAEINPLRVFDCKRELCQKSIKGAPLINQFWCESCISHFDEVRNNLDSIKIKYFLDPFLVRGFDYYTKTTFEVRSSLLGAQNALGGGGRYDGLIESYGGSSTPAIGFALGTERILLALENEKITIPASSKVEIFIVSLDEESRKKAFEILYNLRNLNIHSEIDFETKSLRSQLKLASKLDASYVLLIGPEELDKNICRFKNMKTSIQEDIDLDKLYDYIKEHFR
ncbi:MAG: histidine--tRNA ligase, partial [Actinobacteria bacterium]|nr:histidine--tRNA ligase [Actinomycetota bacterium]